MKLSIIVPAYNEEKTIHLILDKIRDVKMINDIEKEILIVNDFSKDNPPLRLEDTTCKYSGRIISISLVL